MEKFCLCELLLANAASKVLKNPGKRSQISKWGDITVEEKV